MKPKNLLFQSIVGCTIIVLSISKTDATGITIPKRTPEEIRAALIKHGIVPQIIEKAPQHAVEVVYNFDNVVDFGTNLTSTQIKDEPTHITWPAEEDSLYTLALIGPDVPTHESPEDKACQHWIVTNIPGNNVFLGENQTEYTGILSFYSYGTHRLIFFVYKQPDKNPIKCTEERREKKIIGYMRAFFHIDIFAAKYHLGQPIAANFFLVQINPFPYNNSHHVPLEIS